MFQSGHERSHRFFAGRQRLVVSSKCVYTPTARFVSDFTRRRVRKRSGCAREPCVYGDRLFMNGQRFIRHRRRSLSRSPWLFSEPARSGRKASGRAPANSPVIRRLPRSPPAPPRAAQIAQLFDWLFSDSRGGQGGVRARVAPAAGGSPRLPRSPPAPPRAAPASLSLFDWLFSDIARSGRKASGRALASRRRIVTASSIASSASSRRPSSLSRIAVVVQRHREVGQEGVRARLRQPPTDRDRLLDRRQRLLAPPQLAQAVRLVVQRAREVGQEGVRARLGQRRGRSPTASSIASSASSRRPGRSRRLDWLFSELRGRAGRRPGAPRPAARQIATASSIAASAPRAAPGRSGGSTGCSATSRGRAGRRPGAPWPARGGSRRPPRSPPALPPAAPGRSGGSTVVQRAREVGQEGVRARLASSRQIATASSIASSAASRRPRSLRRLDWLFSDAARSGRKASGCAMASSRRIATASSIASSAASRRPSSTEPDGLAVEELRRRGRRGRAWGTRFAGVEGLGGWRPRRARAAPRFAWEVSLRFGRRARGSGHSRGRRRGARPRGSPICWATVSAVPQSVGRWSASACRRACRAVRWARAV